MIHAELGFPVGSSEMPMFGGAVYFEHIDISAAVLASILIGILAIFFSKTKIGRGLRMADDHQAALSVGISLNQIWVIVWFVAGIVALVGGFLGRPIGCIIRVTNYRFESIAGFNYWWFYLCSWRDLRRADHWIRRKNI